MMVSQDATSTTTAIGAALRQHADRDGYVPVAALRERFPVEVLAAHLLPALAQVNRHREAVGG
ncbi:hypothetical protein [Azospirillum himalayense]|uniref:Uncharacterized protein n=1 Tax=Azospirillum himalayense TaxID=654847 RepID=A0ABW0GF36_9PROT